jgi:hypothetical protein
MKTGSVIEEHILSLLANRMAKVEGSGSPSLTSAAAFQTQLRSLPTLGLNFMSGTTKIHQHMEGIQLDSSGWQLTVVVGADLEGLVSAHDQTGLAILLVLQQPNIAGTTLLPLLAITVESEELGAHLEDLLFKLFVGLGLNLLGQADDRLEVNIGGLGGLILCEFLKILAFYHPSDSPSGGSV